MSTLLWHRIALLLLPVAPAFAPAADAPAGPADVRSFGATGDGSGDDAAAIERAIASGAGSIEFPKGIYRISKTVTVDLDKTGPIALFGHGTARIRMAGPGAAFEFIGTHQGTASPDTFKTDVWDRQRTPMVDGLEITGDHPEADGIAAAGTMQLTVTRCALRELRHGIRLFRRNRNVLIDACHIYNNHGIGIFYDDVSLHQSNIGDCHISYCDGGGVVSRAGDVRNVHIGNCDIESNMATNAPPTANILLDSSGGSIGEVAITGCTIQHNNQSPDSANIRIIGGGRAGGLAKRIGSEFTSEGHVTITGNVLSDVRVNVHVRGARGVVLTGNTFWMGYDHDLLVEDSSNIVVGENNFDRNPRYNYGTSQAANGGIVFRGCRDSTLNGIHVNGALRQPAAVLVENCARMNITGCTILDSDGPGLAMANTSRSHVSACLIRDDRAEKAPAPSLKITGGAGNLIGQNMLGSGAEIDPASTARSAR